MNDVINKSSGLSNASERGLTALIEGSQKSNFAMRLMLKDVTLATQLGVNCGSPMMLQNIARALLQTGLYRNGPDAKINETTDLNETMANIKLT